MVENFYNTVLLPPHDLEVAAIKFATEKLTIKPEGYCLSPNGGIPHITLCQSHIKNSAQLDQLLNSVSLFKFPAVTIEFENFYPADTHGDFAYCGLECRMPNSALQKIHEMVLNFHQIHEIPYRGKIGIQYWPHLTFLRYRSNEKVERLKLPEIFKRPHDGWTLAVGEGDEPGQLLKIIKRLEISSSILAKNSAPSP